MAGMGHLQTCAGSRRKSAAPPKADIGVKAPSCPPRARAGLPEPIERSDVLLPTRSAVAEAQQTPRLRCCAPRETSALQGFGCARSAKPGGCQVADTGCAFL